MGTPSGVTQSWKLWRHCCCRNGFYPVLMLPLVTVGCLLTAYSSTGCRWVELDVGFTPNNEGWEYSSGMKDFGFFYQYDESVVHDSAIRGTFHPGCALHPDPFFENFIEGDRTFKMTRYMALISIASSGVAMVRRKILCSLLH